VGAGGDAAGGGELKGKVKAEEERRGGRRREVG
jgi:hypothetical protein